MISVIVAAIHVQWAPIHTIVVGAVEIRRNRTPIRPRVRQLSNRITSDRTSSTSVEIVRIVTATIVRLTKAQNLHPKQPMKNRIDHNE